MSAITSIDESDLEFDHGSFDAAAFAKRALSDWRALAAIVDYRLLNPEATQRQVESLCYEAVRYRFACALVQPVWVSAAVSILAGASVPVGAVVGFPFGASLVSTLRQEAAALLRLGARELNMVVPIGQLKSGNHHAVQHAIATTANVAHHYGAILKVILETSLLTMEERLRAAEIAIQSGADFLQTSTGINGNGASPADVALLRGVAGGRSGVCASGDLHTLADVKALLEAGANRVCLTNPIPILRELGAE